MGLRNYDRWPPEDWRRTAETVSQMRKARWEVISYCRVCHLTMRADLNLVERVSGSHTVLWNRKARYRRIGCDGVVEFLGKPLKVTNYIRLNAEWPERDPF
jgi:hypothetical protein